VLTALLPPAGTAATQPCLVAPMTVMLRNAAAADAGTGAPVPTATVRLPPAAISAFGAPVPLRLSTSRVCVTGTNPPRPGALDGVDKK
jgi:hypothetical protein